MGTGILLYYNLMISGQYAYKGNRNGRGYWISADGKSAIWYYPAYSEWMIGSKSYIGTEFRGISAGQSSVLCPNQNERRWTFWTGNGWLANNRKSQIHVYCVDDYSEQKQIKKMGPTSYFYSGWGNKSTGRLGTNVYSPVRIRSLAIILCCIIVLENKYISI